MALLFLLAVAIVPAHARGPARGRTVEAPYNSPVVGAQAGAGGYGVGAYYWNCEDGTGCAVFKRNRGDNFVSFEVHDTTGLTVHARVFDFNRLLIEFCGKTEAPLDVRHTGLIFVHVVAGTCFEPASSTPTRGTVEATFFNKRP